MNWYLFAAIALIAFIGVVFVVSFVHNRKTPVPEGCEQLKIEETSCLACKVESCSIKEKFEYEKLKQEIEKEDNKGDKN